MQSVLLSKEDSFILLCCCIEPDAQQRSTINAALTPDLDWEYIIGIAVRHGIASMIYKNIIGLENHSYVSPLIFEHLRKFYHGAAYNNLLLLNEFKKIARAFNAEQIPFLPLKGIDFFKTIYGNIALRPANDIDILVKRVDLNHAIETLCGLGYDQKRTAHPTEELFHCVFSRPVATATIFVELHWDLDIPQSPFKVCVDDFWKRAHIVTSGGNWFYRPSLEDTILFTAFHILRAPLAGDTLGIVSLRGLVDVAEMIKKHGGKINWDRIFSRAQQYRVERPLLTVLYLLEVFFNVRVRENLWDTLRAQGFQEEMLRHMIGEWIFSHKEAKDIFLPNIIEAVASPGGTIKKLSLLKIFNTIYIVLRHQLRTAPSLLNAVRAIRKKFWKSFINYLKIVYLMICDYRQINRILHDELVKRSKLEEIDNWIRGR